MDEMFKKGPGWENRVHQEYFHNATFRRFRAVPLAANASILKDNDGRIIGAIQTFRPLSGLIASGPKYYSGHTFENMISRNQKMLDIFSNLKLIADSDCTVLIEGATGTGKEMIARAVPQQQSPEKTAPLYRSIAGRFQTRSLNRSFLDIKPVPLPMPRPTNRGVLNELATAPFFLMRLVTSPQPLQVRLLRVLENKVFEPLGAVRPRDTNARVVVASHRNLDRMVAEEKFREDLYFRINVMKLHLPKLVERKEGHPSAGRAFHRPFLIKKSVKILVASQTEAMDILAYYDWPGNVRELENAIEACFRSLPGKDNRCTTPARQASIEKQNIRSDSQSDTKTDRRKNYCADTSEK